MSMFPFFLVLTAIAGIIGSKDLADEAARIVLEAWPEEVSAPIAAEIHNVLTGAHGQVLTVGVLLALYFASSGIESLSIALNRAYNMVDMRPWWLLRLESIGYVIVAAVALLALSFLVVLAPVIWRTVFFFQAEDGIRDLTVTGVQTCALPIYRSDKLRLRLLRTLYTGQEEVVIAVAEVVTKAGPAIRDVHEIVSEGP